VTGNTRVFYYPAILAFSLVFPPLVTVVLTASVLGFVFMAGVGNNLDVRVIVAQLLSLGVTALIGWRYREVERRRRARRAEFAREPFASEAGRIEEQEDLFYGQIVCILARWALIGGALFLCLYQTTDVSRLERSLIPLMLIIAANFFLQARYMMALPAKQAAAAMRRRHRPDCHHRYCGRRQSRVLRFLLPGGGGIRAGVRPPVHPDVHRHAGVGLCSGLCAGAARNSLQRR
jgi:hypothetical protein